MSSSNRKKHRVIFSQARASGKAGRSLEARSRQTFATTILIFRATPKSFKAGHGWKPHQKFPKTTLEVQHVFEDDDLVAVHSRVQHAPNTLPIAVVHIFRFEGDQIAELWDVAMEAPQDSPNENGMF